MPLPRPPLVLASSLAALLLLAASTASADEAAIERARGELGELRYEEALETLDKSLRSGTNGPRELADIYLLLGEVRASLGDDAAAQEAFRHALVIRPESELRDGMSPKIVEPFERAGKSLRKVKPLTIVHRHLKRDEPIVAVIVQDDPLKLVVGARLVHWEDGGAERSVAGVGGERIDLRLPDGVDRFMVAAIDRHGNRVAELGSRDAPLSLDIDSGGAKPAGDGRVAAAVTSDDEGRPLYAHWATWGAAAVVVAGVGVWAGLRTRSAIDELDEIAAMSEMYEFSDAQAVADRAERNALVANISFGVAGACAIVSGVLYFKASKRSSGEAERAPAAAVAPHLGPGSAGVTARFTF